MASATESVSTTVGDPTQINYSWADDSDQELDFNAPVFSDDEEYRNAPATSSIASNIDSQPMARTSSGGGGGDGERVSRQRRVSASRGEGTGDITASRWASHSPSRAAGANNGGGSTKGNSSGTPRIPHALPAKPTTVAPLSSRTSRPNVPRSASPSQRSGSRDGHQWRSSSSNQDRRQADGRRQQHPQEQDHHHHGAYMDSINTRQHPSPKRNSGERWEKVQHEDRPYPDRQQPHPYSSRSYKEARPQATTELPHGQRRDRSPSDSSAHRRNHSPDHGQPAGRGRSPSNDSPHQRSASSPQRQATRQPPTMYHEWVEEQEARNNSSMNRKKTFSSSPAHAEGRWMKNTDNIPDRPYVDIPTRQPNSRKYSNEVSEDGGRSSSSTAYRNRQNSTGEQQHRPTTTPTATTATTLQTANAKASPPSHPYTATKSDNEDRILFRGVAAAAAAATASPPATRSLSPARSIHSPTRSSTNSSTHSDTKEAAGSSIASALANMGAKASIWATPTTTTTTTATTATTATTTTTTAATTETKPVAAVGVEGSMWATKKSSTPLAPAVKASVAAEGRSSTIGTRGTKGSGKGGRTGSRHNSGAYEAESTPEPPVSSKPWWEQSTYGVKSVETSSTTGTTNVATTTTTRSDVDQLSDKLRSTSVHGSHPDDHEAKMNRRREMGQKKLEGVDALGLVSRGGDRASG